MFETLDSLLGLHLTVDELSWLHLIARTFVVFFVGVVLVRVQGSFVEINMPFMLNFALGSLLASAIISEHIFFKIICMVMLVTFINWFLAILSLRISWVDHLLRGHGDVLISHGRVNTKNMARHLVSMEKLSDAIFEATGSRHTSKVQKAIFTAEGNIVVILRNNKNMSANSDNRF